MFQKRRSVKLTKASHYLTNQNKKRKDRSLLENWRLISFVNVDAKIMSKAIASRIRSVMVNIIHHNQTGFVRDRYIGETARSIFDIILRFTGKENPPGVMIFIDFEKTFDSLEWNLPSKILKVFF